MRCVLDNPVREAFVIYSVNYVQHTPNQPSAGRSGRCSSQKSIPEPQMRPRQDGWGRCRIWAYCRLDSGVKQSAVARGKGAATALMNFIARVNAQPELKKAATAVN